MSQEEADFARALDVHRRELHVHCYRMLASYDEAEDAVQEVAIKAWTKREQFDGDNLRAWLYRIATNTCLDALRKKKRQVPEAHSPADLAWLTPYPDRLLDEVAAPDDHGPDALAVARETVELAFLTACQTLPPQQRAVLLLRDVLGWSAEETADAMETSVAGANSALQRARATMAERIPHGRDEWSARQPTEAEHGVLLQFIDAHERGDADLARSLARHDLRVTMPPYDMCFDGLEGFAPLLERAFGPDREGDWRLVPTELNRMPAAASYLRRFGETEFRAFKFDVLRVEDGGIAEITTFGPALFAVCGLPEVLRP